MHTLTTKTDRLSRLEGAYEQVDQRLGDLARSVESSRDEMNTRLDAMDAKFEAKLNVLIGVAGGSGVAIVLALLGIAFAG